MKPVTRYLLCLFLLVAGSLLFGPVAPVRADATANPAAAGPVFPGKPLTTLTARDRGTNSARTGLSGVRLAQMKNRYREHRRRGSSGVLPGIGLGLTIRLAPQTTNPPRTRKPAVRKRKPRRRRPGRIVTVPMRSDEVIVMLENARRANLEGELARRHRLEPLESLTIDLLDMRVQKFRVRGRRSRARVIRALRADRRVFLVQSNYLYRLSSDDESGAGGGAQYALDKLNVEPANKLSKGRDVTVAVIDAGVDGQHPALKDAIVQQYNAAPGVPFKAEAHGTGVAGIIAGRGNVRGVAPLSKVLAISAFYRNARTKALETSSFILLRAIDHADKYGARIINLSFSGPNDPALGMIIKAAHAKGMIFVAAAGNGGPKARAAFPAAYPEVIAVTAVDYRDRLYAKANRGKYLTLAAPGVDVLAPSPDQRYEYQSGTSFAAAHISGLIALLLERDPQLGDRAVRRAITVSARDLGPRGRDPIFGAGRADAYTSLLALETKQ